MLTSSCECPLGPGGYIQWDEPQQSKLLPFGVLNHKCPVDHMNRARELLFSISTSIDRSISYGPELSRLFHQGGLEECWTDVVRNDSRPEMRQEINENAVVALTAIFQKALTTTGGNIVGFGGQKELEELLEGIKEEMRDGKAWWAQEMYVVIGRKGIRSN